MKITILLPTFILVFGAATAIDGQLASLPEAKVTVVVKDENGIAVGGARVGLGGTMEPKPGEAAKGMTNPSGEFTAEVRTNGEVGVTVRKEGYYDTLGPNLNFRNEKGAMDRAFAVGRWAPWNTRIYLDLKRIIKPTGMYARKVEEKIPIQDAPVSYDLEVGDWVAPNGSGKTGDFIFVVNRIIQNDRDYSTTTTLAFSNKGDGVKEFRAAPHSGSIFRSPHRAPQDGYLSGKAWRQARSPGRSGTADSFLQDVKDDRNYLFRVRTVLDERGQTASALYGKIYGDVRVFVGTKAPKPGIEFTYYLNPTPNDRNIEFDPKQNLFKSLKPQEQVTEP